MANGLTNVQVLLNAYISQEYAENSQHPQETEFFEFFAASQVLKEYDLSDEEVENGLCDATLDGGCDGIYLFADRSLVDETITSFDHLKKGVALDLVIIQSKTTPSFGEDSIMKWKVTCSNLLDMAKSSDAFRDRYNEKVRSSFDLFKKTHISLVRKNPKLNVRFFYVSKGNEVHPNVQGQANELKNLIKQLFPNPSTSVEVNFIGAGELLDLAHRIANNEFLLKLSETPISNTTATVFVTLVNLADFYRFIIDENKELIRHIFEANVRDYQGDVAVNKSIQDSLESTSSEDFWWLNNGATIVASNANLVTNKDIMIYDPEIVNGLQTSTEIYNYFSQNQDKLDSEQRNILVRIIVPSNEDSRDKIIFATNNQTAIQKSSLRATDGIHRQIEMYFKSKNLFYDRRKNYYKNNGKKAVHIISVSFLSQCLISVLLQSPNDARARPSTLLTDDAIYDELYNERQNLDVFYYVAAVGRRVEVILRSRCNLSTTQISDIKFYVLFAAFAKVIGHIEMTSRDVASMQLNDITDELIVQIANEVLNIYVKQGGTDRVAKGTGLITALKTELLKRQSGAVDSF